MIYVLKDNVLVGTLDDLTYWMPPLYRTIDDCNRAFPKTFPTDCFAYETHDKEWYVKRTRKRLRPLPEGMVPKELKMVLLLLGVPT